MIELVAAEAARTVIGSSMGYFIGKWFGKNEQRKRCSFLWDLEMEVSPRLLKKLIDQEVKEGCISAEEADDRFAKILDIRQRYGLLGGASSFVVANVSDASAQQSPQPPTAKPVSTKPPSVVSLADAALLQQRAKEEVGPPSALVKGKTIKFLPKF